MFFLVSVTHKKTGTTKPPLARLCGALLALMWTMERAGWGVRGSVPQRRPLSSPSAWGSHAHADTIAAGVGTVPGVTTTRHNKDALYGASQARPSLLPTSCPWRLSTLPSLSQTGEEGRAAPGCEAQPKSLPPPSPLASSPAPSSSLHLPSRYHHPQTSHSTRTEPSLG